MSKIFKKKDGHFSLYKNRRKAGFTLIELLVSLAIISILLTLAFPFRSQLILKNNVSDTSKNLISSLRKAQIYSMAGKDGSNWGVKYSNSKIIFYRESTNTTFDTYDVPSNIEITGLNQVIFSKPAGLPSTTGEFIVSSSSDSKSILLNSEGIVSVGE